MDIYKDDAYDKFVDWEKSTKDAIDFKRIYFDITGNINTALLLSQIIFWFLPGPETGKLKLRVKKHGRYWIAKKRAEWWHECRLSPYQFDRASKILIRKKLIIKQVYKFQNSPQVHISVEFDQLLQCLRELQRASDVNEFRILKFAN